MPPYPYELSDRYPDWPTLLTAIRRRPGMFLGHPTISGLDHFLSGLGFAEDFYRVVEGERLGGFNFPAFEKWVESRFNPQRLPLNSFGIATHVAGSDAAAFDLWFAWYDEFMKRDVTASPDEN